MVEINRNMSPFTWDLKKQYIYHSYCFVYSFIYCEIHICVLQQNTNAYLIFDWRYNFPFLCFHMVTTNLFFLNLTQ